MKSSDLLRLSPASDLPVLAAGEVLLLLVSFPPEAPAPLSPPMPEDPPEADIVPSTSSKLCLFRLAPGEWPEVELAIVCLDVGMRNKLSLTSHKNP